MGGGEALEDAGLDPDEHRWRQHWDDDVLVETILEMHERGERLDWGYVRSNHPEIFGAAAKRFSGSWYAAVEMAGLSKDDLVRPRGPW